MNPGGRVRGRFNLLFIFSWEFLSKLIPGVDRMRYVLDGMYLSEFILRSKIERPQVNCIVCTVVQAMKGKADKTFPWTSFPLTSNSIVPFENKMFFNQARPSPSFSSR